MPLKACPDFALQYRYRGRTSGGGAALRAPSPSVLTTVAAAEMSQNSSENEEEDEKEDKVEEEHPATLLTEICIAMRRTILPVNLPVVDIAGQMSDLFLLRVRDPSH